MLTLSSLRKPKRLTILGDDEKEYNFLVKGGEDLRNDGAFTCPFVSFDMKCVSFHQLLSWLFFISTCSFFDVFETQQLKFKNIIIIITC